SRLGIALGLWSALFAACQHEIPPPEITLVTPLEGEVLTRDGELTFTVLAPEGVLHEISVRVDEYPVRFPAVELKRFGRFRIPLEVLELGEGEHGILVSAVAAEDDARSVASVGRLFAVELPPATLENLVISPEIIHQGQPVILDAYFEGTLVSVGGEMFDRPFNFYHVESGRWRALAACHLFAVPGMNGLTVTYTDAYGRTETSEFDLTVHRGDFPYCYIVLSPSVGGKLLETETIERESAMVKEEVKRYSPEQLWEPGPFRRPVEGGYVTSPFGEVRDFSTGGSESHIGTDFGGLPEGTPVYAAARGRVVFAREFIIRGDFVCLDHGRGLFTLYNHMSEIAVTEGEMVEAGQRIGAIGQTGVATGPHLHFEARLATWAVDPMTLLAEGLSFE
ncbi:M23 family metallopeptidase, partial [bacterium]|nr:M23 family metallopeptidase [bacterium]